MSYKAKIIIFVLVVVLLVPSAVTVFLNQADIKHSIESYILSKTGRALIIEGDLATKWSLSPMVYAKQIKFANSPLARTPFAFSADKLTVSLSVVALLRGELEITAIELDKPKLWIEWLAETKRFNLDLRTSRKVTKKKRFLPDWVNIKKFMIRHGEIVYFRKNRDWEFKIHDAMLKSTGVDRPTYVVASGEVEKTAVSMTGELGSLESLLRFQESPVTLTGYVGVPTNRVSVSGVIQNVLRWYGLNLWVDAQVTNLADLSDLFGFWLPPYRNISAKGELIQPQTARTMRLSSLQLHSSDHGLQARAEGKIGQLIGFNEVDITFNAQGNLDKKVLLSNLAHRVAKEVKLDTTIVGRVFGSRRDLTLDIEHAEILVEGIRIDAAGAVSNVLRDWSAPLPLDMNIENLDSLIRVFNLPQGTPELRWADMQAIHVTANLNRQKSRFSLQDIKISSASGGLNLDAMGEINALGSNYSGEIEFDTRLNRQQLGQISTSRFLALLDELSMMGTVSLQDSVMRLSHVEVHGKGDGINLNGVGLVGNLENFQGFQMDIQLSANSLDRLASLANQTLPHAGPLDMNGVLAKDAEGKFNLNTMMATLADPDLTITAEGEILALGATPNINLNIDMQLDSVAPIEQMYPQFSFSDVLSALLPLHANAQLSNQVLGSQTDGQTDSYSLNNLQVATLSDTFNGQVHGRIDHLFAKQGLSGKLALELAGVVDDELMAAVPALKPLRLSGDWSGSMDIIFSGDDIGLDNIDFNNKSAQATLNASGALSRLSPLQPDKFAFQFDVGTLATIIRNTDLPLVMDNPAKGTVSFSHRDNSHNIMLDVEIAGSDLSGEINFIDSEVGDTADSKRIYRAELGSKNIDLAELLVQADESDQFFSDTPLKLDWLMGVLATVNFSADHFRSTSFSLDNFRSTIAIDNGMHASLSGDSSQGSMSSNLILSKDGILSNDDQAQKWHAYLDGNGKNVDFSALTKLRKSADNVGLFSVVMHLNGAGSSIAEIASNANGAFLLEISEAEVKSEGLQLIGGDLLSGTFVAINPLSKQDKYTDIECGVIQFDVKQGVATHRSALKTTKVTVLGDGAIKLDDETLKIRIRTKARKGLGVNVNTIAKIIQVGGTIKNPRIETDSKGLIQSGIAIGAAIATGGLSLLAQGLYDKTQANADVCRIVDDGEAN